MLRLVEPLAPGSRIGILGGGQLGRMLAVAAARLGYQTVIFAPDHDCIAAEVAGQRIDASYSNEAALREFAVRCDVVTIEFENVPSSCLEFLGALVPVAPGPSILSITQDRQREKTFAASCGIETADFVGIDTLDELRRAVSDGVANSILKTRRMGYDGRGQVRISATGELEQAWSSIGGAPAILETVVPFEREISVITARSWNGEAVSFPPVENRHVNGILNETIAPANLSETTAKEAVRIAEKLALNMKLVGLLAVEMFVLPGGQLLVNEMAPRPHNSGHWSIDACVVSQFEQTLRAAANLPLGDCSDFRHARMRNLIGEDVQAWPQYLRDRRARLHIYGKEETRVGRKMGHVTWVD